MVRAAALCLLVVSCALPCRAGEDATAEAERRFRAGIELYKQKRTVEALTELEAAYRLTPSPRILYALGQAERQRGNCKAAAEYYRRFLETDPPKHVAEAARINTVRCVAEAPPPPPPKPEPPPPASTLAPSPSPPPPSPPPASVVAPPAKANVVAPARADQRSRRLGWSGVALAAVGVAGLGAGLGLIVDARALNQQLNNPPPNTHYDNNVMVRRDTEATASIGLFAAGGALAVTGAVLATLMLRRQPRRHAQLVPLVSPGGAGALMTVSF